MGAALKLTAFFFVLAVSSPATSQERYIDFWFRYFIGNDHPTVKKTGNGLHVLEAPPLPLPFTDIGKLQGTCFTTDQRGFSNSIDAQARVSVALRVIIKGRELRVEDIPGKPKIAIGDTRNVDCTTGANLQAPLKAPASSVSISDVKVIEFARNFSVLIAASDPFYKILGYPVAPRISSEILFSYELLSRKLQVRMRIEPFPWIEAYYRIEGAGITQVINSAPDKTTTVLSLFDFGTGINARNVDFSIDLLE